jgi:hypothetical protein
MRDTMHIYEKDTVQNRTQSKITLFHTLKNKAMNNTEFTPHAHIALSNSGGIEIMLNRSNDGVYYRFVNCNVLKEAKIYEKEILYSYPLNDEEESRPYFKHGHTRYYLDEAMKIK